MHTIVLHDENGDVRGRVHHNSDWSGNAVLDHDGDLVTFPAEALRAAACGIALMYLRAVAEEGIGEPDVRAVDVEDTLLAGHVVRSAMVATSAGAQWMPLRDAPKGAVFETKDGVRAVKSEYGYDRGGCLCILLSSGGFAHFGKTPKEHDATLVRVVR